MRQFNRTAAFILTFLLVFCFSFAGVGGAALAAGLTVIPAGADYSIYGDGVYQLANGYGGRVTISHNATIVTLMGAADGAVNQNTSVTADGARTTALELTIQNLKIKSTSGSALDFSNAVSLDNKLYIKGACELTGSAGTPGAAIRVPAGVSLTVDKAAGLTDAQARLTAKGGYKSAAIGGSDHESCGTLAILGGTIVAQAGVNVLSEGQGQGAGIGGGYCGSGGVLTIGGGVVAATGDYYSAGIGGGFHGDGAAVTINGGTVTATGYGYEGNDGGAGIGGGIGGDGGVFILNAGTVTATGGSGAPGVGGGHGRGSGTVTIKGGKLTAKGGEEAAGIGTSSAGSGAGLLHSIDISGGTVTATGGADGAGIGSGPSNTTAGAYNSGTVTISGGVVTARGGMSGAGIGGGQSSGGGTVNLFGGTVTATGGGSGGGGGAITVKGAAIVIAVGDAYNPSADIGMGHNGTESGTLADDLGNDLSYIRFVVKGGSAALAGASVVLNGKAFTTNASGLAGGFTGRISSVSFTVSKAGYKPYQGSFVASAKNHVVNVTMLLATKPTVTKPKITASGVTSSGAALSWTKASDGAASSALKYRVYCSKSNNLGSVAAIEANGTPLNGYTANIGKFTAKGLKPNTVYYLNVVVANAAMAKSCYATVKIKTLPVGTALSGLQVTGGAMTPAFAPVKLAYTVKVASNVDSVTVRPVAADPLAKITVNGKAVASGAQSPPIAVGAGKTVKATVVVTGAGSAARTYTLTIARAAAKSVGVIAVYFLNTTAK